MSKQLLRRTAWMLGLTACFLGTLPAAVINLSNIVTYGSNSSGDYTGGITATSGCCQSIAVEVGAFNSGASAVGLPYALGVGSYTLYLSTSPDWSGGLTYGAVNVYFDNHTAADISVVGGVTFDKTVFPAFSSTGSTSSKGLSFEVVTASGTSSYTSSGLTVSVDGLQWVGGSGSNPYDSRETVIRLDLTVSEGAVPAATPEPATFALIGGAFLLLGATRFRKSRNS